MNKDFLKEVLTGKKTLLPLGEVRRINMPLYDELSVVRIWPLMQNDQTFPLHFPSKLPKGRLPDRCYFFNILNTLYQEYCTSIMKHANKARMTSLTEDQFADSIEVNDEWWDKLQQLPFKSCKYNYICNVYVEHKGRTLHLLKQKSKAVPQDRKRKKVELFGTLE